MKTKLACYTKYGLIDEVISQARIFRGAAFNNNLES